MYDAELVRLVQVGGQGAIGAFEALFDRTNRQLEAFLAKKGLTRPEIEEVAEESWERALECLSTYEDRGLPFVVWLRRFAINVLHERMRYKWKLQPFPDEYKAVAFDAWARDPLIQLTERESLIELGAVLREAIAALKPGQRAVIERRLVLGKSSREVADELGWTVTKVDTTLHRARAACREYLLERHGFRPAVHGATPRRRPT